MGKEGAASRRSTAFLSKRSQERRVVGVIGGDSACIRAVVRHWTGRAPSKVLLGDNRVVCLPDADNLRDLVFLFDLAPILDPWPGGPLIWLYPERGPSEPELAQMRLVLRTNAAASPALRVLLCLPHDIEVDAASADLDIISETLRWAVDPDVEMDIEAVWLSGGHEATLPVWLAALE